MNPEFNERIERAQQGIARLRKIDSILIQLELDKLKTGRQKCKLEVILEKEKDDVTKLENASLASIFYSVLGSFEDHVEKERSEVLAARLKFNQAEKDLADIQEQIIMFNAERSKYLDCQKEFECLYAQKEEELIWENGDIAQKMLDLSDKTNLARINIREIEEATDAGQEAFDSLDRVDNSLDKAEGWGIFDLLGGGLISDLVKHSHIDEAKGETENTQRLLRRFKTELTDINVNRDIVMETEGLAKFADFFFDGLIADWFMQSKINESQISVSEVKDQVSCILEKLEHLKEEEKSAIIRLETEIRELIVKA